MHVHAVEHGAPAFVLVEAEMQETAQIAPALRGAVRQCPAHAAGQRIGVAGIVLLGMAKKGNKIARGSEAEAEHNRVLRRVDQLIDVIGVEPTLQAEMRRARNTRKRLARAIGERPIGGGHRYRRIALPHLDGEKIARIVGADRFVGNAAAEIGIAEPERASWREQFVFLAHAAGDAAAIRRVRHGRVQPDRAGQQIALPAAPYDGEAVALQEPVAGSRGIVASGCADVEHVQRDWVAAIDDVVEHRAVAARHLGGFQDGDVHGIRDLAGRVVWRERDVLDDGVVRIARIDFAVGRAGQQLETADGAKRNAAESGFGMRYVQARDPRLGWHGGQERQPGNQGS